MTLAWRQRCAVRSRYDEAIAIATGDLGDGLGEFMVDCEHGF